MHPTDGATASHARRAAMAPRNGLRTLLLLACTACFVASASAQDARSSNRKKNDKTVKATLRQLRDAWISVDAALVGTYAGIDSTLGPIYHALDIDEVWLGTPMSGRLLFKAPRGVGLEPGDDALFMLWDRLNAATDSYLENATRLHGDEAWRLVGPDSLASYLLPFDSYAFPFDGKRMRLRGTSVYSADMKRSELRGALLDYELTLVPSALFEASDLVVRARVAHVDKRKREIEDIAVEFRVYVNFEILGTLKGEPPAELQLDYSSYPRSPRFDVGENVVLFLREVEGRYFLRHGKRDVFHIVDGAVAETGQAFPQFVEALGAPSE